MECCQEWAAGVTLEERYLLVDVYLQMEDKVVWSVYDKLLGSMILALEHEKNNPKEAYRWAKKLEKFHLISKSSQKILSLKKVEKKWLLFFALEDEEEKEKEQIITLLLDLSIPDEKSVDFESYLGLGDERQEVLRRDTMLDGRYRILDCIGIGGFGIVYLCQDFYLERLVAVKEYFPAEWVEREESYVSVKDSSKLSAYRFGFQSFLEEIRIMGKFIHTPHIVTIFDAFKENDTAYFVMEYIGGISIGREMRMREYKPYAPEELVKILYPIMEALETMHMEKVLHSDISPANIMRTENDEICLIDFGAAKDLSYTKPMLAAAFLKVDYAAPEQYRTAKRGIAQDEGPWTDIYALAATMYYLLTGTKPPDVITRLGKESMEIDFPEGFRISQKKKWKNWINHAMWPEIDKRIANVAQFREEGKSFLHLTVKNKI